MAASAPPRQFSIAKPTTAARQSGILPAPGTPKRTGTTQQKDHNVKLKVLVRRLAPGLTREEFDAAIGSEWKVGAGKVNWISYQKGKIAKDAAKPSRPSRAYLNLTNPQHLGPLADKIRSTQFVDSKGSFTDYVLLGPPTLVSAPFGKVPSKPKVDGRQGTIDQDPEFIDFLTSLTDPVVKPTNVDQSNDKTDKDVKIITPLVQYIKDKRANKGKDSKKHSRQESKDSPIKADDKRHSVKHGKGKSVIIDKKSPVMTRADKARQEAVIAANKVIRQQESSQPSSASATQPIAPAVAPIQPKPERRRERGNVSMAAKILRRDLGLAPAGGRRRREIAANVPPVQSSTSVAPEPETPAESAPVASLIVPSAPVDSITSPTPTVQIPTGPAIDNKPQAQPAPTPRSAPAKPLPNITSVATQAFLKHANPSQGVTEPLLEEAFKAFGTVINVEIDKRKGFAYIDFADSASLKNAIAASPVKVAQGSVVVLERKTGSTLQNRNVRGPNSPASTTNRGARNGRGRGGRNVSLAPRVNPAAAPAPVLAPDPVTAPT